METRVIDNETIMQGIRQLISEGRSVTLRCKGNSMNPFLVSGRDSVVLSPCRVEDLRPGDVALVKDFHGRYILHRIVSIDDGVLTLNGDGNFAGSVEKATDVIAVMSGFERRGRRGSVDGRRWRSYSAFWAFAGRAAVGSWSLRRVILGVWRRL